MAAIKAYTDLEQSRKLAEILPIESADMYYSKHSLENYYSPIPLIGKYSNIRNDIPCWSLAALLKLIPNFNMFKRTIECRIETTNHLVDKACEPIDAAFEMICWLKENNKI